jgi:hypothetical protein
MWHISPEVHIIIETCTSCCSLFPFLLILYHEILFTIPIMNIEKYFNYSPLNSPHNKIALIQSGRIDKMESSP